MQHTKTFHSTRGCLSYLVYDDRSKQAALIDPSTEITEQIYLDAIKELGLTLSYVIDTHTHADHISSARSLRDSTQAKIVMHIDAPAQTKDIGAKDGDVLSLGTSSLLIKHTPGHTNDSITVYGEHAVYTGDTLLIGGTGRTDFQQGDSEALYDSIWEKIMNMPEDTILYPGHNYQKRGQGSLSEEREKNIRLQWCKSEFIHEMDRHHPPKPELFDIAIKENSK